MLLIAFCAATSALLGFPVQIATPMDVSERAPDLHCTVSLGAAEASPQSDVDAWVRQADDALYRAKLAGRNRFVAAATDAALR